ncbi:MAG: MOSC domain-containing protein [Candidatus Limnocylindrales bacterium]
MLTVARFSIAPVRSLGLQHPDEIDVTMLGVVEDRRFFLSDLSNRLADRIVVGRLVQVESRTDPGATTLWMRFPDGTVIEDGVQLGEAVETPIHGRIGVGHLVIGPWADALEPIAGRKVRVIRCDRPGGTRVGNPTSLVSDGSIRELTRQFGLEAMDSRRFRMLIEIAGAEAHEEDTWIGGRIAVGDAILRVTKPVARCAITTQDPDTGRRDLDTLRTIIDYRGLRDGKHADFGVLADVEQPGRIRLGDEVIVLGAPAGSEVRTTTTVVMPSSR